MPSHRREGSGRRRGRPPQHSDTTMSSIDPSDYYYYDADVLASPTGDQLHAAMALQYVRRVLSERREDHLSSMASKPRSPQASCAEADDEWKHPAPPSPSAGYYRRDSRVYDPLASSALTRRTKCFSSTRAVEMIALANGIQQAEEEAERDSPSLLSRRASLSHHYTTSGASRYASTIAPTPSSSAGQRPGSRCNMSSERRRRDPRRAESFASEGASHLHRASVPVMDVMALQTREPAGELESTVAYRSERTHLPAVCAAGRQPSASRRTQSRRRPKPLGPLTQKELTDVFFVKGKGPVMARDAYLFYLSHTR